MIFKKHTKLFRKKPTIPKSEFDIKVGTIIEKLGKKPVSRNEKTILILKKRRDKARKKIGKISSKYVLRKNVPSSAVEKINKIVHDAGLDVSRRPTRTVDRSPLWGQSNVHGREYRYGPRAQRATARPPQRTPQAPAAGQARAGTHANITKEELIQALNENMLRAPNKRIALNLNSLKDMLKNDIIAPERALIHLRNKIKEAETTQRDSWTNLSINAKKNMLSMIDYDPETAKRYAPETRQAQEQPPKTPARAKAQQTQSTRRPLTREGVNAFFATLNKRIEEAPTEKVRDQLLSIKRDAERVRADTKSTRDKKAFREALNQANKNMQNVVNQNLPEFQISQRIRRLDRIYNALGEKVINENVSQNQRQDILSARRRIREQKESISKWKETGEFNKGNPDFVGSVINSTDSLISDMKSDLAFLQPAKKAQGSSASRQFGPPQEAIDREITRVRETHDGVLIEDINAQIEMLERLNRTSFRPGETSQDYSRIQNAMTELEKIKSQISGRGPERQGSPSISVKEGRQRLDALKGKIQDITVRETFLDGVSKGILKAKNHNAKEEARRLQLVHDYVKTGQRSAEEGMAEVKEIMEDFNREKQSIQTRTSPPPTESSEFGRHTFDHSRRYQEQETRNRSGYGKETEGTTEPPTLGSLRELLKFTPQSAESSSSPAPTPKSPPVPEVNAWRQNINPEMREAGESIEKISGTIGELPPINEKIKFATSNALQELQELNIKLNSGEIHPNRALEKKENIVNTFVRNLDPELTQLKAPEDLKRDVIKKIMQSAEFGRRVSVAEPPPVRLSQVEERLPETRRKWTTKKEIAFKDTAIDRIADMQSRLTKLESSPLKQRALEILNGVADGLTAEPGADRITEQVAHDILDKMIKNLKSKGLRLEEL